LLEYHMFTHFKNYELGQYICNDPIQNSSLIILLQCFLIPSTG